MDEIHSIRTSATARATYAKAVKNCPKSVSLWILASRLEEKAGLLIKARATLERGRLLNPKTPQLWCEAVRVELRGNNINMAKALLAKALQECSNSGLLWSEAIFMEPRPQRKTKSVDALKRCDNDPIIIATIARLFWAERKVDKARTWFEKAVKVDPDRGDSWAWLRCVAAEPHHGERWQIVAKDMKNVGKNIEEILKLVANVLSN
jgi:pre-mRNA-processing factor 6